MKYARASPPPSLVLCYGSTLSIVLVCLGPSFLSSASLGAYSPNPHHSTSRRQASLRRADGNVEHDLEQTLTVQVEDVDAVGSKPTILLVRPFKVSPPTPPLPEFCRNTLDVPGAHHERDHLSPNPSEGLLEDDSALHFSPVPLTPRPQQPARGPSVHSVATMQTTMSHMSRLPTPNFGTRAGDTLRSYFPRLLSFGGVHGASHVAPEVHRPPSIRSESSSSTTSDGSTAISRIASCSSGSDTANSQRPSLLPSFSTTDKFTQKFPRPRSVKNLTYSDGQKSAFAATVLEEGDGLGIEGVDRWSLHKWCLLLSVCTLLVYGLAGLVCAIVTWFRTWQQADVMYVADNDILVLITLSSSILLLAFLVGIGGTILNSRPILAVYAILLWPAFLSILAIGYTGYKRYAFALDRKLNLAWSQWYTPIGRLIIQDSLRCCGYYNALHEATASKQCYPRTPLPGCKGKLYRFERENLAMIWSTAFALVPVHILNIVVSLLCANHVTRTFGKGIMPRRYWLSGADVRADAERLMGNFAGARPVVRPQLTRPPSSGIFREDRQDCVSLVDDDWNHVDASIPVGLGLVRRREGEETFDP